MVTDKSRLFEVTNARRHEQASETVGVTQDARRGLIQGVPSYNSPSSDLIFSVASESVQMTEKCEIQSWLCRIASFSDEKGKCMWKRLWSITLQQDHTRISHKEVTSSPSVTSSQTLDMTSFSWHVIPPQEGFFSPPVQNLINYSWAASLELRRHFYRGSRS